MARDTLGLNSKLSDINSSIKQYHAAQNSKHGRVVVLGLLIGSLGVITLLNSATVTGLSVVNVQASTHYGLVAIAGIVGLFLLSKILGR